MTTIESTGAAHATSIKANFKLVQNFGVAWRQLIARHQHRRLIKKLARLSPRLLRDMGYDPEAVYAARAGAWDQRPNGPFPDLRIE